MAQPELTADAHTVTIDKTVHLAAQFEGGPLLLAGGSCTLAGAAQVFIDTEVKGSKPCEVCYQPVSG